jgi:hypothetical protein
MAVQQLLPYIFNQVRWRRAQMPRPKSELTGSKRIIGARLTEDEFKEWRKLGGSIWLRKYLEEHKRKRESKNG